MALARAQLALVALAAWLLRAEGVCLMLWDPALCHDGNLTLLPQTAGALSPSCLDGSPYGVYVPRTRTPQSGAARCPLHQAQPQAGARPAPPERLARRRRASSKHAPLCCSSPGVLVPATLAPARC